MLRLLKVLLIASFLGLPATALADNHGGVAYDDGAPDVEFVYVTGAELEDGSVAPGFYRRAVRDGYAWVPAGYSANGVWTRGYWRPVAQRQKHVWVRGHVGPDGYWVPGHWRRASRDGFVWVPTSRVNGSWRTGFWKPASARSGYVWVSGRRGPRGVWLAGHWRKVSRPDHVWVPGYWKYGRWIRGHWRPAKARASMVWVPGHWSYAKKRWIPGRWRSKAKPGYHWRRASYRNGVWVPATWAKGVRPVVKRVHPRVRPVRVMRTTHKRTLRRRGKTQRAVGKHQVRKGKAMKAVGRATGNDKLKRKGKRVEKRGKKNKRKGNRKVRRSRR